MARCRWGYVVVLVLMGQTSSFGADRAAFERSIAGMVPDVNVRAHPNPITYLVTVGEFYCRLKAAKGGSLDVQEAAAALRKAEPAMAGQSAGEVMAVDAALAEAKKYLCP